MDIDLLNIGYTFRTHKLYANAEKSYQLAILKKQHAGKTALDSITAYFQLYKVYDLQGKKNEALKALQTGYDKTRDTMLLYTIGTYNIENGNVGRGIEILKSLLNSKLTGATGWSKPTDELYTNIATGYWKLKNKKQAKLFVNKALGVNPSSEAALKLKAVIK